MVIYHKPCTGWSNRDQAGNLLGWEGLHARAKEFLFTEGTFQSLSLDHAAYAIALITGTNLMAWHDRADWAARAAKARKFPVSYADARKKTIVRMAMTAMGTAQQSGMQVTATRKNKEVRFKTQTALETYISHLMDQQSGVCALSGLGMLLDGGSDDALVYSLDRIDSEGHYEEGNLQLVCKFANRWKGAMPNPEFLRLAELMRMGGS